MKGLLGARQAANPLSGQHCGQPSSFLTLKRRAGPAPAARQFGGRAKSPCYSERVRSSLYDIDPGPNCPEIVRMIVEIPKNSGNKYEYDGALGVFRPAPVSKVRIEFLTPTELKSKDQIADVPEFPILFGRIRDRLSTLSALYGRGPMAIDFAALGERAEAVRLAQCDIHPVSATRRSGRTGQTHPIGGFVGSAEYEGELAEFLPYLEAARWTGVGRQTVWGKGEIRVSPNERG
jgi:hypothetical protein